MAAHVSRAVSERAGEAIRRLIVEHGYQVGDPLPSQRDLTALLGVSRTSLREAISALATLGIVSVQPGRGVFVQSPSGSPLDGSRAIQWPFDDRMSPAEAFQLRFALEGFAAGLASVAATAEDLDFLEDNVEAMRRELKAQAFDAAAALDYAFHRHIVARSGSAPIGRIVTSTADIFLESQKLPFIRPERAMETWHEHRRILRAFARRSGRTARRAMQDHIRAAALRTGVNFAVPED